MDVIVHLNEDSLEEHWVFQPMLENKLLECRKIGHSIETPYLPPKPSSFRSTITSVPFSNFFSSLPPPITCSLIILPFMYIIKALKSINCAVVSLAVTRIKRVGIWNADK